MRADLGPMERDVAEFRQKMGQPVANLPVVAGATSRLTQADMMREEATELHWAMSNGGLLEIGLEAADLIYTALGCLAMHGLKLEPFWRRVHEANMAKEPSPTPGGKAIKPRGWKKPDGDAALTECYPTTTSTIAGAPDTKPTNPKDAVGCGKTPTHYIPVPVLYEVGAALLEGACKYGAFNWRIAGVRPSIYVDAARRHMDKFWEGRDVDPDSGINEISKAIAGLVVLRDAQMQGMMHDDRPPPAKKGWAERIQEQVTAILARYPEGQRKRPFTWQDTPQ